MAETLKIGIIGDFNFSLNSHHATNLAMEHAQIFLDTDINYYWIRTLEVLNWKREDFNNYDGFILASGPYENNFFMRGIIKQLIENRKATLITGEGFKYFIDLLIDQNNLHPNGEKLISENLINDGQFEKVEVTPHSDNLKKIYQDFTRTELTLCRYSMYPHLINFLTKEIIDIEAINQLDEPEIISMKSIDFFVGTMHLPQICSTREMPHPLIYSFINFICLKEQV